MANPLNISKIESDPCGGLTSAQLAPYQGDVRNTKKSESNNGPICSFNPTDTHNPSVHLNVFPRLGGVSGLYDTGANFPFFERAGMVGGYPATHMAQGKNGPREGECETDVAASDMAVFGVYVQTTAKSWAHYGDTCTVSDQLVVAVINNLKSGS